MKEGKDTAKPFNRYPMEIGEELEVESSELSAKEEGVAKVQSLVIYVPYSSLEPM